MIVKIRNIIMSKEKIICCPFNVIDGYLITKEKRQELFGKVAGGSGSCNPEKYQRKNIIDGTGIDCPKTHM